MCNIPGLPAPPIRKYDGWLELGTFSLPPPMWRYVSPSHVTVTLRKEGMARVWFGFRVVCVCFSGALHETIQQCGGNGGEAAGLRSFHRFWLLGKKHPQVRKQLKNFIVRVSFRRQTVFGDALSSRKKGPFHHPLAGLEEKDGMFPKKIFTIIIP